MSGVFVEVGWRSGLGAGSREVDTETKKKSDGRSAQEERRRGRAVAMCSVAAMRALWLCGT